jgi:hypothetical protein
MNSGLVTLRSQHFIRGQHFALIVLNAGVILSPWQLVGPVLRTLFLKANVFYTI